MTAKDLKNALLQEAVQGKLVPQIASEGNARDLLEEIREAKQEGESHPLSSARKRSSATPYAGSNAARNACFEPISEDEIPFDIPESWCWCRLGDCVNVQSSKRVFEKDYVSSGIPFYRSKEIGELSRGNSINTELFITKEHFNKLRETVGLPQKGDILLCSIGGSIGNTWINDGRDFYYKDGNVTQICNNQFVDTVYINYYLHSELFTKQVKSEVAGSAYNALTIIKIKNLIFPLPPLAEQKRIVAAIEKFMPLIEEYGKKETVLNQLNTEIGTLTKKAILQEAVQGKLVPQDSSEGSAKDLLKEIKAQKEALIKEGKIKREKPLSEITEDEIPFDIPENWCWCKVGDLFSTMSGLGYKKDVLAEKSEKMIRVLRGGNILDTSYVFKDDDIMISSKYVDSSLFLRKNFLITPAVTSLEHIGKMGYIEQDYDDTVVGGFVLMLIPYFNNEVTSKYCLYLFGTHWFRSLCKEITHKSGQAFYNLSRDKLLQLEIPLPPLSEQKRIVAAIEQLLPLCEKLGK